MSGSRPAARRVRVGVRVGVVDSGINPRDPQVGGVEDGVGLRFREGRVERDDSWVDFLGHGTAVAATIAGHAPEAVLYSIRIFRRRLEAPVETLFHAIDWARERKLDLLNLSLGCASEPHYGDFLAACARAVAEGVAVVTAFHPNDFDFELDRRVVVSVVADPNLEENELRADADGRFHASSWARRRGELPRERNFHGTSFAVANVSGIGARLMAADPSLRADDLAPALVRYAEGFTI